MYVCMYVPECVCVCVCVCVRVCLFVYQPIDQSINQSINQSVCVTVCRSIYLTVNVHLSFHVSVCWSMSTQHNFIKQLTHIITTSISNNIICKVPMILTTHLYFTFHGTPVIAVCRHRSTKSKLVQRQGTVKYVALM